MSKSTEQKLQEEYEARVKHRKEHAVKTRRTYWLKKQPNKKGGKDEKVDHNINDGFVTEHPGFS